MSPKLHLESHPHLPLELMPVMRSALALNPQDRPLTCHEFVTAIEAVCAPRHQLQHRKSLLVLAGLVAGVVVGSVGLRNFWPQISPPQTLTPIVITQIVEVTRVVSETVVVTATATPTPEGTETIVLTTTPKTSTPTLIPPTSTRIPIATPTQGVIEDK